jgi:hypothetical protein
MEPSGEKNKEAVAARIAMLLEAERRASEERKAEKRRRIRTLTFIFLIPLALLTLYALVQFLRT